MSLLELYWVEFESSELKRFEWMSHRFTRVARPFNALYFCV